MEQTNNPARLALAVREQVDSRLKEARKDWQLQWESERRRLNPKSNTQEGRKHRREARSRAPRRAAKARKAPVRGNEDAEDWEKEFDAGKVKWDAEREELNRFSSSKDRSSTTGIDPAGGLSGAASQYEPKLEAYEHERKRLRDDSNP